MNAVHRRKAGFMHVHLKDNQLHTSSCAGNLVQPWWSFQRRRSNPPRVDHSQKQGHFRMWCCVLSVVFIFILWFEDAKASNSSRYRPVAWKQQKILTSWLSGWLKSDDSRCVLVCVLQQEKKNLSSCPFMSQWHKKMWESVKEALKEQVKCSIS